MSTSIDRLQELTSSIETKSIEDDKVAVDKVVVDGTLKQLVNDYDFVNDLLKQLQVWSSEITLQTYKYKQSSTEEIRNRIAKIVDVRANQCQTICVRLKQVLDQLCQSSHTHKSTHTHKSNLIYSYYQRRIITMVQAHHRILKQFKVTVDQVHRRTLLIIDPELDAPKIDQIIESGQIQEYVNKHLTNKHLTSQVSSVTETFCAVEERHILISEIEQQTGQILELFKDMSTLVDLQGE